MSRRSRTTGYTWATGIGIVGAHFLAIILIALIVTVCTGGMK